jgi:alkanesulfonate monooxygenase SsuD/methylene tetrahydromethanopterin reductase-like flavin-dependent oxidoreductase (luciferase family)
MRVDANFFCTVPMDDAGKVEPTKRRYDNNAVVECYKNLVAWAKTADEVGIDTMWLTEHHFQYCVWVRCSMWCHSGTRFDLPKTLPSPTL